jgi:hypothetical protein
MKTGVKQTPETTMDNAQHKYSAENDKVNTYLWFTNNMFSGCIILISQYPEDDLFSGIVYHVVW